LPQEKNTSLKAAFINVFRTGRGRGYSLQKALQDISFEVKEGEFFGIVGRNGSGKSTLLKIIASIYQPTSGKLEVSGKLVPFIELGVGFNPELTGRQNVYLNGALLGFSRKQIDDKYADIVEFAELEKFMDQKLKNYSSGMQVRLAFSMAIRADADILLIDEVLAVGDADFQRKCFSYFRNLKKHKKTVIFVSHDMDAIREYCDRAILIEDGLIIAEGVSSKVASEYTKLFEDPSVAVKPGEAARPIRWGNKNIHYLNVTPQPQKLDKQDPFQIICELKANKDVENAVVGFSIKNESDIWLFGTNNKLLGKKLSFKKGDKMRLSWEMPNLFSQGTYFVNVTAETESLAACDWWEEATTFEVVKDTHTGYVVAPALKLKIN
jgi:ABC-2 type transport system ATP-binding protein